MRFRVLWFFLSLPLYAGDFLVKPYLQLGDNPHDAGKMTLMWHAPDGAAGFTVQTKAAGSSQWSTPVTPQSTLVNLAPIEPHRVYSAILERLKPGAEFDYRVLEAGKPLFEARARARKTDRQNYRFVVFGDCGQNTPAQKQIAAQTYLAKPDFVFITGDIVYSRGKISEYREKHFPIYNADEVSPSAGAPLLRSVMFIAAPGNHDIATANFRADPDLQAYFYYWSQPLNGPDVKYTATLDGPEELQKNFRAAAGRSYPRMANFSFDYGNAHWTVLDANPYVDWRDPELREWVAKDLDSAKGAAWRFVGFHHPGFNSSKTHFNEQHMRLLSEVFEAGKVDVVFTGHVHNYQRSKPMRFVPAPGSLPKGRVDGQLTLDEQYDGIAKTKPRGVIYLVTGAGGARLYDPPQQDDPGSWQPFTKRFVSQVNSLTRVDVEGKRLTVRQVDVEGREVDRFVIAK